MTSRVICARFPFAMTFEEFIKDKLNASDLSQEALVRYKIAYIKDCIEKCAECSIPFAVFSFNGEVKNLKWIDHHIGKFLRGCWRIIQEDYKNDLIIVNDNCPNFKENMEALADKLVNNPPRIWDVEFIRIARANWGDSSGMEFTPFQKQCGLSEDGFKEYVFRAMPTLKDKGWDSIKRMYSKEALVVREQDYKREGVINKLAEITSAGEQWVYDWAILTYTGDFHHLAQRALEGKMNGEKMSYPTWILPKDKDSQTYTNVCIVNRDNKPTFKADMERIFATESKETAHANNPYYKGKAVALKTVSALK